MNNFNVQGFLGTLETQNQGQTSHQKKEDNPVEKVYLSFPGNYGKYQVLPMNSVSTGYPFVKMNQTREIKLPKKITYQDGTEKEFDNWIKILPKEAYNVIDTSGGNARIVNSLTASEENLLLRTQQAFDMLYNELGGNSKERNPELNKTIGLMRRRNYTVFYAKCLNMWETGTSRPVVVKQNFPALFVCTAKGFTESIIANINDCAISFGDPEQWIPKIYNRDLTGREGFFVFTISRPANQISYSIVASHSVSPVKDAVITEEEAEFMKDPVEGFLGWQASREPGKLFNAKIMEETLNDINSMLAKVRSNAGQNIDLAAQATNPQREFSTPTMDSMIPQSTPEFVSSNEYVSANNTDPYSTPAQAQIDPINQNPVNTSNTRAPFASNVNFGGFGSANTPQQGNSGLPF